MVSAVLALPLVLAGCAAGTATATPAVTVAASDTACGLSATSAPAGVMTFAITNTGAQMTEFYVYDASGAAILAEIENIGPGITRELTTELAAGTVTTACRPNGTGAGIRASFTVTAGTAAPSSTSDALGKAVLDYRAFVQTESGALLARTEDFVAAVKAGDVAAAKKIYPQARVHWERIEPVAESFAELDPKLDARENDVEPGTPWTGWHRIEKALWVSGSTAGMASYADQLLADTTDLVGRIPTVSITPTLLGNGATELLQEVATGKVTGEEERYSRTDLWDFQANVEGAHQAFLALSPVIEAKDPALHTALVTRFGDLFDELGLHARGTGFVLYDSLSKAEVRELAAKVDALSESLSQVTAAVVR